MNISYVLNFFLLYNLCGRFMINYSPLLLEDVKFYDTFYWRCGEGEQIQMGNLHWLVVATQLKKKGETTREKHQDGIDNTDKNTK